MSGEHLFLRSPACIPNDQLPIKAGGGESRAVRTKGQREHRAGMLGIVNLRLGSIRDCKKRCQR